MKKALIIAEIKRTAAQNDGVPLGRDRFERETGIRTADWFGVHWARWSDALVEAGFEPNELQGAFDKDLLLQKYAELSLELQRLPVRGDLALKRRANPEFPHFNTFERFGPKREFVRQLAEYCRSKEQFTDIVEWCERYLNSCKSDSLESTEEEEEIIGYVYLFKSGRFYKIGKSNSAGRREYELGIQLPERIETVHVIRTDDPNGIETYWHRRFEPKRKNGEWFELEAADVRAFKRRKFM